MIIEIKDDFSLEKIRKSGQCFRVTESGGVFRFITGKKALYISEISPDTFEADCTPEDWAKIWSPYFDLSRNYAEIRKSIPATDSFLTSAAGEGVGIRILRQEPWEMLVTFIISQQKTIPAITATVEMLCARYGEPFDTGRETLYAFPTPERLAEVTAQELAACRLGYRVSYVMDAARRGDISGLAALSDEDLLAGLLAVKGVGVKVANCVALFAFGRCSLAPVDTWIKKLIDGVYKGENPFPAYGAVAGIMQQYAFFYAQNHKQEINLLSEAK